MARTVEPITMSGWYAHTDGTVGQYRWQDGQPVLVRTAQTWTEVEQIKERALREAAWGREG